MSNQHCWTVPQQMLLLAAHLAWITKRKNFKNQWYIAVEKHKNKIAAKVYIETEITFWYLKQIYQDSENNI